jgi:hypothetical protein
MDRVVRRNRRRLDDCRTPRGDEDLARRNRRGTPDEEEMTKADQTVESAANKLEELVRDAQRSGGVKAKVGDAFAEDPEFLRKLKPSLIAARAKGEMPTDGPARSAPPGPQLVRPKPKRKSRGLNPWVVIGAALACGYMLAKILDWRGHGHPRN